MSLVHRRVIAQMRAREAPLQASVRVSGSTPPSDVTLGLPSARDTVRVYANRLDGQIEKINSAWHSWLQQVLAKGLSLTDDQIKFDAEWPAFYSAWKVYLNSISSFNPFGLSPTQAWDQVAKYDDQAEAYRLRLASWTTAPPPAPNIGDQPSPVTDAAKKAAEAFSTAVKWTFAAGLGFAGVALYLHHREQMSHR